MNDKITKLLAMILTACLLTACQVPPESEKTDTSAATTTTISTTKPETAAVTESNADSTESAELESPEDEIYAEFMSVEQKLQQPQRGRISTDPMERISDRGFMGVVVFAYNDGDKTYFVYENGDRYGVDVVEPTVYGDNARKICDINIANNHFDEIAPVARGIRAFKDVMFFLTDDGVYRLHLPSKRFEQIYDDAKGEFLYLLEGKEVSELLQCTPITNYTFCMGIDGGIPQYPLRFFNTETGEIFSASEDDMQTVGTGDFYDLYQYVKNKSEE
jgi:hypothetical protein